MPEPFNPYHEWLGIPAGKRPNHYQLLGIQLFEDAPNVIENAADRQMAHLRTFQGGARAADSQRLLNEVSSARVCLLKPEQKAAYDAKLRAALAEPSPRALPQAVSLDPAPAATRVQPMSARPIAAYPTPVVQAAQPAPSNVIDSFIVHDTMSSAGRKRKSRGKQPGATGAGIYGVVAAVAVAGVAAIAWLSVGPKMPQVADGGRAQQAPNANDNEKPHNDAEREPQRLPDRSSPAGAGHGSQGGDGAMASDKPSKSGEAAAAPPAAHLPKNAEPQRKSDNSDAVIRSIATSEKAPQIWRYTFDWPADDWMQPDFDDANWQRGPGGFGEGKRAESRERTQWPTSDIWLRREFELADLKLVPSTLRASHDDDAEVYINGVLAAQLARDSGYVETELGLAARGAYRQGANVLAVHCHQTGGSQYIDAGLVNFQAAPTSSPPTAEKVARGKPIDLLKLIDPKRDSVSGHWEVTNGILSSPSETFARVQIPLTPPPEYSLKVVGEREKGADLLIGLVIAGKQVAVMLDAASKTITALAMVDGKSYQDSPIASRVNNVLGDRQRYTVACDVRESNIRVSVNGAELLSWEGTPDRLSLWPQWSTPRPDRLFIGTYQAVHRISSITLAPLSTRGAVARAKTNRAPAGVAMKPKRPPGTAVAQVELAEQANTEAAAEPEPAAKTPIPSEAEQAEARKLVNELFKPDIAAARKSGTMADVARKILIQATDSQSEVAGQYVLYGMSRDLAAEAGDSLVAMQAIDGLSRTFPVDALSMKAAALAKAGQSSKGGPAAKATLVSAALPLIDEAAAAEQFDVAKRLMTIALEAATASKDVTRAKQIRARGKDLVALQKQSDEAHAALDVLKQTPDDPAANRAVGLWYCLTKNDWQAGLPHLEKSGDAALADIAKQEMAGPDEVEGQQKLADAWWDLGDKQAQESLKTKMRARAAAHYREVLPSLSGLSKARAEKRIEGIAATSTGAISGKSTKFQSNPKSIDLLKLIDPARDAVNGQWRMEKGALICPQSASARLVAPLQPPQNYVITAEGIRTGDAIGGVVFGIIVDGRQAMVGFDGLSGEASGLELIDGKPIRENPTRNNVRNVLGNNKPFSIIVTVHPNSVNAQVNQREMIAWQGNSSSLGLADYWAVPRRDCLFVGAENANIKFTKLSIKPIREFEK